jgi:hypothetical protein
VVELTKQAIAIALRNPDSVMFERTFYMSGKRGDAVCGWVNAKPFVVTLPEEALYIDSALQWSSQCE